MLTPLICRQGTLCRTSVSNRSTGTNTICIRLIGTQVLCHGLRNYSSSPTATTTRVHQLGCCTKAVRQTLMSSLALYHYINFSYFCTQTFSQDSPTDFQSVVSHSLILIVSHPRAAQTQSRSKI